MARDEEGKPYSVRYEAVNAMLLNEFLKEHRKVEVQASALQEQTRKLEQLQATVSRLQEAVEHDAFRSGDND